MAISTREIARNCLPQRSNAVESDQRYRAFSELRSERSHDFNNIHGLAHDPNRVTLSLEDYNAKVPVLGQRLPSPQGSKPPRVDVRARVCVCVLDVYLHL